MEPFYNTRQAAKILGVSQSKLARAIWDEKLDPPVKTASGQFLWVQKDLERASWQLLKRPLDQVASKAVAQ